VRTTAEFKTTVDTVVFVKQKQGKRQCVEGGDMKIGVHTESGQSLKCELMTEMENCVQCETLTESGQNIQWQVLA